jgi:membrane protein
MDHRELARLLWDAATEWRTDKAGRLAAALSLYALLALAPLLWLVIAVAAQVVGQDAAAGQIVAPLHEWVGSEAATAIQTVVAGVITAQPRTTATLLSIATFLFAASHLFAELKSALNTIWNVRRSSEGSVLDWLRTRALACLSVIGSALVLGLALSVDTALMTMTQYLGVGALAARGQALLTLAGVTLAFGVLSLLSAVIYKLLPDATIAWRDVGIGALVTAGLLLAGQGLIGWYLRHSQVSAAFGPLGSFMALMLWILFSSQIVLFGAEFTWVYANRYGSHVLPAPDAEISQPT